MKTWIAAIAMSATVGVSHAGNLCSIDPFTKADAAQGKIAFDSHCAFCHQYSMTGRQPGNYKNESPALSVLSESDLKMIDGNAGRCRRCSVRNSSLNGGIKPSLISATR